jgi:hypothetical protein
MIRARSLGVYEKRYYHLWLNQPRSTPPYTSYSTPVTAWAYRPNSAWNWKWKKLPSGLVEALPVPPKSRAPHAALFVLFAPCPTRCPFCFVCAVFHTKPLKPCATPATVAVCHTELPASCYHMMWRRVSHEATEALYPHVRQHVRIRKTSSTEMKRKASSTELLDKTIWNPRPVVGLLSRATRESGGSFLLPPHPTTTSSPSDLFRPVPRSRSLVPPSLLLSCTPLCCPCIAQRTILAPV